MTADPAAPLSREAEALAEWQEAVSDAYDHLRRALSSPSATREQRTAAAVDAVGDLNEAGARLIEAVARPERYEPAEAHQRGRAG